MSFLRKAVLINSTEFVCMALGVAQNVMLTRILGPDGIGQYAIIISAMPLAALVCCLGVPISFLYHSQRNPDKTKEYLINAFWLLSGLGFAGGLLLVVLIFTQQGYFGTLPGYAMGMIFIFMPVALWQVLARNSLLIDIQARRLSIIRLLMGIGTVLLILCLWGVGILKVPQAVVCYIIPCFIPLILGWVWIRPMIDFSIRPSFGISQELIVMGIKLNWADLMIVVNTQASIFVVRYLLGSFEQVGYFTRGLSISMLAVIASQTALPMLFSRWAALPEKDLARHVEKVMRFAASMALAVIIVILLGGKWIVLIMYGARFLPAVKPMMILVPGSVLYLLSRIMRELLNSRGRPEMSGLAMLVSTVVNVILCWSLVPQMGTAGAALAQTSANVLLLVAFALMVRNKYKIRLNHCLILKTRDVLSVIQEFRNMRTKDVQ